MESQINIIKIIYGIVLITIGATTSAYLFREGFRKAIFEKHKRFKNRKKPVILLVGDRDKIQSFIDAQTINIKSFFIVDVNTTIVDLKEIKFSGAGYFEGFEKVSLEVRKYISDKRISVVKTEL